MRRILPFVGLFCLAACGRDEGIVVTTSRATAVDVPSAKVLAGRPVKDSQNGAWDVRVARRESASAGGGVRPRLAHGDKAVTGGAAGAGGIAEGDTEDAAAAREREGSELKGEAPAAMPAPVPAPSAPPPAGTPRFAGPAGAVPPGLREPSDAPAASRDPLSGSQPSGLKAGATDDNADFDAYLKFLATWSDRADTPETMDALDVSERRYLTVTDAAGRPFPGARIHVVDEAKDATLWEATTYGDGRAPFYPRAALNLAPGAKAPSVPAGGWLVEVRTPLSGSMKTVRWDGKGDLSVRLDATRNAAEPVRLDVGFLVDTTGSMGDEIERIKTTLLEVTRRLKDLGREFDLRYAAVLYKDVDDDYVTMTHPFTGDVDAFAKALAVMTASGGGDTPESLNQGLAEAVGRLTWHDGAAKVLFLVADASPHMDYEGDVRYGTSVKAAIGKGIRIHAVAASGLEPFGTLVFRQVAQATRGKFVFIEYGTPGASAAGHGVTGKVKSNNLDDILFEQIQDEIASWGRAPLAATPPGVSTSIR